MALPSTLTKTAAAARGWGKITAVDSLADCVVSLIKANQVAFSPFETDKAA
jgi:hypothetical protein